MLFSEIKLTSIILNQIGRIQVSKILTILGLVTAIVNSAVIF